MDVIGCLPDVLWLSISHYRAVGRHGVFGSTCQSHAPGPGALGLFRRNQRPGHAHGEDYRYRRQFLKYPTILQDSKC